MKTIIFFKTLFFSTIISICNAQNNIVNDTLINIIISEDRLQMPFEQSTRNIQIFTQKEIKKLPAKNLNEILSYISGVDLRQRGPFGSQADISINGGTFEQTLILLNSVKISDSQTAHHSLNLPISIDAIERIEILKGPAARIYGVNALNGAINIVTKKIKENTFLANIYSGSSFKKREANDGKGIYWGAGTQLLGGIYKKNQNHIISLSKDKFNGHRYNSSGNATKIFYNGNFTINTNNKLDFMFGNINNEFGANGFYAAPGDRDSYEKVKTTIASISSKNIISNKLIIKPRINYRYNEDDYRYFKNDLSRARSEHFTNGISTEINAIYETDIATLGFGWESKWENIKSSNIGIHKRNNHGFYSEFKKNYQDKLFLTGGVYLNYNSNYEIEAFPGLDIAYKINSNIKVATNIGSGQRIPSFTDLYLNQMPGNIGNPDLKSEKAWQYDLSLKFTKNNFGINTNYFYRNITDFIDWTRLDIALPYQPENLNSTKIQGLNIETKFSINFNTDHRIEMSNSYTYLNPEILKISNNKISKYAIESLKHQNILRINYQLNKFFITFTHKYLDRELQNSYHINDLKFSYNLKFIEIYTDATNIFNTEYKEIQTVPLPTRWLSIGLKYNFLSKNNIDL